MKCLNCEKEILSKRSKKFCDLSCQGKFLRKENIQNWLNGKSVPRRYVIKEWLTEQYGYKCSSCGISDWNNKPITLWVDHIDGNASNNHYSNFKLICPNCDSQQDTFGAKNKGKGRRSLGLKPYD